MEETVPSPAVPIALELATYSLDIATALVKLVIRETSVQKVRKIP